MAKVYLRVTDSGDQTVGIYGWQYSIPLPFEISEIYRPNESERQDLQEFKTWIDEIYSDFSNGQYDSYFVFEDSVSFRLDSNRRPPH